MVLMEEPDLGSGAGRARPPHEEIQLVFGADLDVHH
jgi:hypothetical protein